MKALRLVEVPESGSLNCQGLAAQGSNPGGPRFKSGLKNA